jgi:hypothetical protein
MTVTNVDSVFALLTTESLDLKDSLGDSHEPVGSSPPFVFDTQLEDGETVRLVVVFEIDESAEPVSLTYAPGLAAYVSIGERVRFEFR